MIHPSQLPLRVLFSPEYVLHLREVLTEWRDDESGETPEKIAFLLDYTYALDKYPRRCATMLKGADARTFTLLNMLAKELGYFVGFASIE